jgi:hypothetical protein
MQRWMRGLLAGGVATIGLAAAASAWPARPVPAAVMQGVSGTAFGVAPGVLVTNAHVALHCQAQGRPLHIVGHGGEWAVLALDADADLALLRGPASGEAVLPLSAAARLPRGAPVLAMGYPTEGVESRTAGSLRSARGDVLRATLTVHDPQGGRAASFVMTDRQGREIEPSWEDGLRYFGADKAARLRWRVEIGAPAGGGSSGGPVLDAAGHVVGVVYAGGRGLTAAIPLEDLRGLLARAGITPVLRAAAPRRDPDWTDVEADAARALYRITC